MPLFKCTKCLYIDNTAVANYWLSPKEPTCSECHTGTWHGHFDKIKHDDPRVTLKEDGFYAIKAISL